MQEAPLSKKIPRDYALGTRVITRHIDQFWVLLRFTTAPPSMSLSKTPIGKFGTFFVYSRRLTLVVGQGMRLPSKPERSLSRGTCCHTKRNFRKPFHSKKHKQTNAGATLNERIKGDRRRYDELDRLSSGEKEKIRLLVGNLVMQEGSKKIPRDYALDTRVITRHIDQGFRFWVLLRFISAPASMSLSKTLSGKFGALFVYS
ncbi:hypothetical protein CDAR_379131 [Caerostris darwini]|uniref:Uncharacterized protein n=1 Tax=Caerostris darwini TaxID=1538125 RepID=A0AAV4S9I1_9ARAC|nr:hypothetical protein CDAR_379131 [Caerostris darwini]